jgi:hypothetical protein
VSGWAPPTGETGVGAVTFRVLPSAAAELEGSCAPLGDTGLVEDLEHATATARTAAAEQSTNLF